MLPFENTAGLCPHLWESSKLESFSNSSKIWKNEVSSYSHSVFLSLRASSSSWICPSRAFILASLCSGVSWPKSLLVIPFSEKVRTVCTGRGNKMKNKQLWIPKVISLPPLCFTPESYWPESKALHYGVQDVNPRPIFSWSKSMCDWSQWVSETILKVKTSDNSDQRETIQTINLFRQ